MDWFLVALALALFLGAVAALAIARVVYVVVGRGLDTIFRAFGWGDPG